MVRSMFFDVISFLDRVDEAKVNKTERNERTGFLFVSSFHFFGQLILKGLHLRLVGNRFLTSTIEWGRNVFITHLRIIAHWPTESRRTRNRRRKMRRNSYWDFPAILRVFPWASISCHWKIWKRWNLIPWGWLVQRDGYIRGNGIHICITNSFSRWRSKSRWRCRFENSLDHRWTSSKHRKRRGFTVGLTCWSRRVGRMVATDVGMEGWWLLLLLLLLLFISRLSVCLLLDDGVCLSGSMYRGMDCDRIRLVVSSTGRERVSSSSRRIVLIVVGGEVIIPRRKSWRTDWNVQSFTIIEQWHCVRVG